MKTELEHVHPAEIERRSFSIISQELGPRTYAGPYDELILKRVIHASADFDYADHLVFSPGRGRKRHGGHPGPVRTLSQIPRWRRPGSTRPLWPGSAGRCAALCPIRTWPGRRGTGGRPGRLSVWSGRRRCSNPIGFGLWASAPTALVRLYELVQEGRLTPALIIGVPVGLSTWWPPRS